MRKRRFIMLIAASLTALVAGCEKRGASTAASPGPRISPAAAPAPAAAIPLRVARAAS